jgi:hypothetical protein
MEQISSHLNGNKSATIFKSGSAYYIDLAENNNHSKLVVASLQIAEDIAEDFVGGFKPTLLNE